MFRLNSLPPVCIAMGFADAASLLEHARHEIGEGETFLEFRLDYLPEPVQGFAVIRDLAATNPEASILATCRRRQNHGRFTGSVEEQIRVLEEAVDAGAAAVDVEVETAEAAGDKLDALRSRTCLVVSYHNFESTPSMEAVLRRMVRVPADVYKLVTTPRKPSDIGRLLALPRAHPRLRLVILGMGESGFPSRVLAPLYGGAYTYAAPSRAEGTAPGQVGARCLRHMYRVGKLSRAGKVYGVIASPVRHTISPAVHNRAFQARRLDSVYVPFLVPPAHLRDFMSLAGQLPVAGFSVTIPHKQKIMKYLDSVDPLARRIGAVNTVWRKAGKWRGANTDAEGVTVPLARRLRLAKASVLLAGNGGAARSAAFALTGAGARVTITGRNLDRVRALAKAVGAEALSREAAEARSFDALVHATPLGMFPDVNESFFPGKIPACVVLDMVYNPPETLLLRQAKEQGLAVIPGLEMFLEQAARQFEIWTGESAPRTAMERAAIEALHHGGEPIMESK